MHGLHHLKPHPVTLLCAMFRTQDEVIQFHKRVKLSAFERELGLFVVEHRGDKVAVNKIRYGWYGDFHTVVTW